MHIQTLAQTFKADADPNWNPSWDFEISDVATIEEAQASHVTFLANPKYIPKLRHCQAGAVFVSHKFADDQVNLPLLRVEDPYLAFAKAIELFHQAPQPPRQIHPTAILGAGVQIGEDVAIGAYVVIGNQVKIGDHVTIHPHCVVYDGAEIGAGCLLHSHAVIREYVQLGQRVIIQNGAVIGADGFGFAPQRDGRLYKIMQAGIVVLEDDVEVQVNSAVDRATVGVTRIGEGSKVDNLVQVGHGCTIGKHSLLCGQVGLAGSTQIGNHVIFAGQAAAAGHLTVGDQVTVAFKGGVINSIAPGTTVGGYPAIEQRQWLKTMAALKDLPDLLRRVRQLEQVGG